MTLSFNAPRPNAQVQAGEYLHPRAEHGARRGRRLHPLRVTVDRVRELCLVDDAEPNNRQDDSLDLMLIPGFTRPGSMVWRGLIPDVDLDLEDRWLCAGDEDWFAFEAKAGDSIRLGGARVDPMIAGDTIIEIRNASARWWGCRVATPAP
ncbi:MAG: hypothetical protein R3F43_01330 [bacterium]